MMRDPLAIYCAVAALAVAGVLGLRAGIFLRERRRCGRDAAVRRRYLRIAVAALTAGDGAVPRFPQIDRSGARAILAETLFGIVSSTYGLDLQLLHRIVADTGLEAWLLRRIRRTQGYRRARCLAQLAALPAQPDRILRTARYLRSRNRYVRFYALMAQLTADSAAALRAMATYPHPFSSDEVAEILAVLRRGMLPVAYEPLLRAPDRNLRRVGLGIVREFGIEEAEERVLHIATEDPDPELGREAIRTLCLLRRPLARRGIVHRIAAMDPARRRALLRCMAQEGYAPRTLRILLDERERPYYESLVRSYKRSLV